METTDLVTPEMRAQERLEEEVAALAAHINAATARWLELVLAFRREGGAARRASTTCCSAGSTTGSCTRAATRSRPARPASCASATATACSAPASPRSPPQGSADQLCEQNERAGLKIDARTNRHGDGDRMELAYVVDMIGLIAA